MNRMRQYRYQGLHETFLSALFAGAAVAGSMATGALAERSGGALQRTSMLPEAIASFGAAVDGQWLYVTGGHTGKAHQHSRDNLSADFMRLNLLDGVTWEKLPGGEARQSVALVAWEGKLYRIGGMYATNARGEPESLYSVTSADVYDPITRTWEKLPDLPEPRSSHDVVAYDGKLYVAGGWTLDDHPREGHWLDHAWVMDLEADERAWASLPKQPFRRRAVALAAAGERLFVMGGITTEGKVSSKVDIYDIASEQWIEGPDYPESGFGMSAFAVDGSIYASGLDGTLHRLDIDTMQWSPATTLTFPRFFHRLLPVDEETLVAVGGAARGGHYRHIEYLSITRNDRPTAPRVWSWETPYPGQAKNRQGILFADQTLRMWGGNNSLGQHDFEEWNFLAEGWEFSLNTMQFRPHTDLPVNRQSMSVVLGGDEGDHAWMIGGFGHNGEAAVTHPEVFAWNNIDDAWEKTAARLPGAGRTQFGAVWRDGAVWIFGGLNYDPRREKDDHFRHETQVLRWDTREMDATFEPAGFAIPQPRRAFGGALLDDRYYMIGGMREGFQLVESCDVYDFESASWSSLPCPAKPRISPEVAVLDGKIYMAGGSSPDEEGNIRPNTSMEVYDPAMRTWSTVMETLPIRPRHMRMFTCNQRLLLVSTHFMEPAKMQLALIDPRSPQGEESATKLQARRPEHDQK